MRRQQGYTVPMVVEESRILQISIFRTLQRNLRSVDFSKVLLDVVTIADEVDSQLKQALMQLRFTKGGFETSDRDWQGRAFLRRCHGYIRFDRIELNERYFP